jgi:demethylmenaquinone methyltransferase/2-methoxy-6-polyprenyl-1,4-benzoquinol methylase
VCLEITLPNAPVFGPLFRFYFFKVVPLIGGVITGQRQAYTYLPHSALKFPQPRRLAEIMRSAGLRDVQYRLAMPGVAGVGTVAIHWGTK